MGLLTHVGIPEGSDQPHPGSSAHEALVALACDHHVASWSLFLRRTAAVSHNREAKKEIRLLERENEVLRQPRRIRSSSMSGKDRAPRSCGDVDVELRRLTS